MSDHAGHAAYETLLEIERRLEILMGNNFFESPVTVSDIAAEILSAIRVFRLVPHPQDTTS